VELPRLHLEGSDARGARKGERPVYWPNAKAYQPTPIYGYESLRPGNVIEGPAVVEGEYTTLVVPSAMKFSMDERGLGILED
jgi:N-methylhydantoinase A/acetophenone carboxylase